MLPVDWWVGLPRALPELFALRIPRPKIAAMPSPTTVVMKYGTHDHVPPSGASESLKIFDVLKAPQNGEQQEDDPDAHEHGADHSHQQVATPSVLSGSTVSCLA